MKNVFLILMASLCSFYAFASVDVAKSELKWEGTKKVGDKHVGVVAFKSIDLKMEKGLIQGGELVVDMNTMITTDLAGEWKAKLEGHLKGEDFFNVTKYPTAKFVIKSVANNKVTGDLTIKDKTNSVTFDIVNDKKTILGTLVIDRTKWGIVYNSNNYFKNLGDKIIDDSIKLEFKVTQL